MENGQEDFGLDYNTQREKLRMPEYGRNVQKMTDYVRSIQNRAKRNEQAESVVKVMEILNPQVHSQEDYEQKLWDHLCIISGFEVLEKGYIGIGDTLRVIVRKPEYPDAKTEINCSAHLFARFEVAFSSCIITYFTTPS